jgi:DNA-binding transcriptional LysR family regulator
LSTFLVLPHVIASTDMTAVVPSNMAIGISLEKSVVSIEPPISLPQFPFYMYWHPRSARDKGLAWLRRAVANNYVIADSRAACARIVIIEEFPMGYSGF